MPKSQIFFILLSIALSACNGDNEPVENTPPTAGADLQTSVPAPDYGSNGSFRESLFNDINLFRASSGLGLLAQSSTLDTAAINHMNYYGTPASELSNNRILETQSSGSTSFTGATPQDRCGFVGYAGRCPDTSQWGASIASPADRYTALLLLTQGARQIGLSDRVDYFALPVYPFIQLGYPDGIGPQKQNENFILATALGGVFHVHINEGDDLSVGRFQIWNSAGLELAGSVVTRDNDPLQRMPAHGAMFVPTEAIPCDHSTYFLSFSGMRDGQPIAFTKDVTFWHGTNGQCY